MIKFKEDKTSLRNRINIHSQYGQKDMVKWVSKLVKRKKNINILDLACGDGIQTIKFSKYLKKRNIKHKIIATDSNLALLSIAKKNYKNGNIIYQKLNFDKIFKFRNQKFDLVICLFGIYYSKNIKETLSEIKKILSERAQLIFVGPLRDNKLDFNRILESATKRKIPPLIGSSRFDSQILREVKKQFKKTQLKKFTNILKISDTKIYLNYMISSVTSKRGVYKSFLKSTPINQIEKKFNEYLNIFFKNKKKMTITKKVGAIIAEK